MTRQEQIAKNQIWQVYPDKDPDNILFEGRKTNCFNFVREKFGMKNYRNGKIRIANLIWEKDETQNL